jgi:hypothetical protein
MAPTQARLINPPTNRSALSIQQQLRQKKPVSNAGFDRADRQ